jgi:hypothetical protein
MGKKGNDVEEGGQGLGLRAKQWEHVALRRTYKEQRGEM